MEEETNDRRDRLEHLVGQVERRVELLRKQASSLKREKESILELLQDVQDGPASDHLADGELDDFEYNIERLILRCLTVEVSVATPRNETQEMAFTTVSAIVEDLQRKLKLNPASHRDMVESHLNACLPEPLSSNVNYRFQEKLLDCTAEDQKHFRKHLEKMLHTAQGKVALHMAKGRDSEARHHSVNGVVNKDGHKDVIALGYHTEDTIQEDKQTASGQSLQNAASIENNKQDTIDRGAR